MRSTHRQYAPGGGRRWRLSLLSAPAGLALVVMASGCNRPPATSPDQADQATVDTLYNLLRGPAPSGSAKRRLPPTMSKILDAVIEAPGPTGATDIATALGLSRPTAQRYLTELQRRGMVELELEYGATGRPVHRYRPVVPSQGR